MPVKSDVDVMSGFARGRVSEGDKEKDNKDKYEGTSFHPFSLGMCGAVRLSFCQSLLELISAKSAC